MRTLVRKEALLRDFGENSPSGLGPRELVDIGVAAVDAGDFAAALAAFDAALVVAPDDGAAHSGRGVALLETGTYEDALAALDRAVQLLPEDGRTREYRGRAYEELKRHEEAIAELTKAIRLGRDTDNVWSFRGRAYHALEQDDLALPDHSRAIELAPNDATDYYLRGEILAAMGRSEEASLDFDRAVARTETDGWAYCRRGIFLTDQGDYGRAIEDLSRAIRLEPGREPIHHNRGRAYHEASQATSTDDTSLGTTSELLEKALADYDEAIRLEPQDPWGYMVRWDVLSDMGEHARALADLHQARALECDPDWLVEQRFGKSYFALEKYKEAAACFRAALAVEPNDSLNSCLAGPTMK